MWNLPEPCTVGIGVSRDRRDVPYCRFNAIVQEEASKLGCVFFHGAADGNHELERAGISGDDTDGWLVPVQLASRFEAEWTPGELSQGDSWDEYSRTAEWFDGPDSSIGVRFADYRDDQE